MFGNKMNAVEKAVKKNNVNALIGLCGGKEKEVIISALEGLGTVGGDDAAHYLVNHLRSEDTDIRVAAAKSLGAIGNKHTKAFLSAQIGKETDPQVKEEMLQAMVKIKEY